MSSSPPDWLNAHGDATPVIDPESHVREYAKRRGRDPNENCPPLVIGGFVDIMIDPMAEAVGAASRTFVLACVAQEPSLVRRAPPGTPIPSCAPDCALANWTATRSASCTCPSAARARSVMTLEELMALGARTFLIAGATGALKPGIQVGDYVIATNALREEGTSYHYQPPEHPARADGPATRALSMPPRPASALPTPAASGAPTPPTASSPARCATTANKAC